ncbi:hypothetical protein QJQ45_011328 [Haematococcus lacustris]|nr:hypothetical protein QJQ45_011328 [Haematococcus lacustris]
MQRPLELCNYEGLEALPPIGKEYEQGYKRVNDRLPKGRQRLHRAAEHRRASYDSLAGRPSDQPALPVLSPLHDFEWSPQAQDLSPASKDSLHMGHMLKDSTNLLSDNVGKFSMGGSGNTSGLNLMASAFPAEPSSSSRARSEISATEDVQVGLSHTHMGHVSLTDTRGVASFAASLEGPIQTLAVLPLSFAFNSGSSGGSSSGSSGSSGGSSGSSSSSGSIHTHDSAAFSSGLWAVRTCSSTTSLA